MKEYRIMAYFTDVYAPRSYKRKIYDSLEAAEKDYEDALEYYSGYRYFKEAVIESREVSEWTA